MFSSVLEFCRSIDIHEFYFQAAKRSGMDCVKVQGGLFANCQEWHFKVAKRSDKNSTILQEIRFPDVHE